MKPLPKIEQVRTRLTEHYGTQEIYAKRDPVHELVATMLSHRTTYTDEKRAYERMRARFGSWDAICQAPEADLRAAIAGVRYPEVKAPRIQETLRRIRAERGAYELDFLVQWPLEEAMNWLLGLPGVGLKTATLLLLFNFRRPVLPVDTHVHRVSQRLGLISPRTSAERAHAELLAQLPPDPKVLFNFHKHGYWHGQRVCTYRNPRCAQCPMTDLCDDFARRTTINSRPAQKATE